MVIHASKTLGRVAEESLENFAEGRSVLVEFLPGMWQGQVIVDRARTYLGRRYELGNFNCEHLVTLALGSKPDSPQLVAWILIGLVGLMVVAAKA
jgi:hypothetical protein